jgi:hypothetical protein
MILLIRLPVAEYCDWTFGGNPPRRGRGVPKLHKNYTYAKKQAFFDNKAYFEATKKHLFCFFLRNYLHISKICCTFAPAFVINPSGTTSKRTTNEDY